MNDMLNPNMAIFPLTLVPARSVNIMPLLAVDRGLICLQAPGSCTYWRRLMWIPTWSSAPKTPTFRWRSADGLGIWVHGTTASLKVSLQNFPIHCVTISSGLLPLSSAISELHGAPHTVTSQRVMRCMNTVICLPIVWKFQREQPVSCCQIQCSYALLR